MKGGCSTDGNELRGLNVVSQAQVYWTGVLCGHAGLDKGGS